MSAGNVSTPQLLAKRCAVGPQARDAVPLTSHMTKTKTTRTYSWGNLFLLLAPESCLKLLIIGSSSYQKRRLVGCCLATTSFLDQSCGHSRGEPSRMAWSTVIPRGERPNSLWSLL